VKINRLSRLKLILMPVFLNRKQICRAAVQQYLFPQLLLTQVRLDSGDERSGPIGVVPLVDTKELQHDDDGLSYCNGPYMVMER